MYKFEYIFHEIFFLQVELECGDLRMSDSIRFTLNHFETPGAKARITGAGCPTEVLENYVP